MEQPLVLSATNLGYVCKLNKALYDLKQSPRSKSYTSMFFSNKGSSIIILLIYVDDIINTGSHSPCLFRIHLYLQIVRALQDRTITQLDIAFMSTRSANSCILQPQLIGKLLRGFFVILRVQFIMTFLFNHLPTSLSLVILMLIGLSESEDKGLTNAALELIWIETFLTKLHISFFTPLVLFCDNLSATHLVAHPILHALTKHIEIDYHFIRDRVLHKSLLVKFTPSRATCDVPTKPLLAPRFQSLKQAIVLHTLSTWGC
ncbi:hypothetical protein AAG906_000349 [Vitis piasezkii]